MDCDDILLLLDDDEDIAVCDYILNTKNRVHHYLDKASGVFDLEKLGDSYCFTHFRFYKDDIRRMRRALNIPELIILKSRVKVSGEEALCILLRRLAYPNR